MIAGLVLVHLGAPAEWPMPLDLTPAMAIAEELTYRDGRWWFECVSCGRATEWEEEPQHFDPAFSIQLCGGSPRCLP